MMLREEEIRKKVKVLKRFYLDVVYFVFVNFILTLIWMTFDRTGTFWPKYVIVVWGIVLIFRAYRMGVFPLIFHRVSFLNQDWEERKVREIMRRKHFDSRHSSDENKKEK